MTYSQENIEKGRGGERAVREELKELGEEYSIFNRVWLNSEQYGDIDHIVVGPHGVYVLETKNWSGELRFEGHECYQNSFQVDKSPSEQARQNADAVLHEVEEAGIHSVPEVKPIVISANSDTYVGIEQVPRGDVFVTPLQYVVEYIDDRLKMYPLSGEDRGKIKDLLDSAD